LVALTRWSVFTILCIIVAVAVPVAIVATYANWFQPAAGDEPPVAESMTGPGYNTPYAAPGITKPLTVPASKAGLPDDEPIIGVEMNGQYRAYLLSAMRGTTSHVVNDVIGLAPVTVTYCDLANCARGFTSKNRSKPLDISTAGLFNGNLLLRTDGEMFSQPTGEGLRKDGATFKPFDDHPLVRTTWKAWRDEHPKTDVYLGPKERPRGIEPTK
jgi:hypothetical protein